VDLSSDLSGRTEQTTGAGSTADMKVSNRRLRCGSAGGSDQVVGGGGQTELAFLRFLADRCGRVEIRCGFADEVPNIDAKIGKISKVTDFSLAFTSLLAKRDFLVAGSERP
jgi:hypothetical protein